MTRFLTRTLALVMALFLAACAAPGGGQAGISGNGTVVSITQGEQGTTTGNVVGTVGGAVAGAWLGSMVGGGTGKTIATAAGGVGGAMVGNKVGSNVSSRPVWTVVVRFEDGIDRVLTTEQQPTFRPGQRVQVFNGAIVPAPK